MKIKITTFKIITKLEKVIKNNKIIILTKYVYFDNIFFTFQENNFGI